MRGIGLVILCVILSLAAGVSLAVSEELDELCIPMKILELKPLSGVEQHRASVQFPHATHFNFSCQRCHHDWKGKTEVQNCTASGCHDQAKTPKNEGQKVSVDKLEIKYYKKAYHALCIGCHRDIREKNKEIEMSKNPIKTVLAKTGPTGCIQCHPKQGK